MEIVPGRESAPVMLGAGRGSPTSAPAEDRDSIAAPQLHMRGCDNSLMSRAAPRSNDAALTHILSFQKCQAAC